MRNKHLESFAVFNTARASVHKIGRLILLSSVKCSQVLSLSHGWSPVAPVVGSATISNPFRLEGSLVRQHRELEKRWSRSHCCATHSHGARHLPFKASVTTGDLVHIFVISFFLPSVPHTDAWLHGSHQVCCCSMLCPPGLAQSLAHSWCSINVSNE